MKSNKRLLAVVLALAMVFAMVPMVATAGEANGNYLTFTAEEDNSKVTFKWNEGSNVEYSTDSVNWIPYTSGNTLTLASVGDYVQFRGSNVTTNSSNHFTMSGKISASGDVTSLTNNAGGEVSLSDSCYSYMFDGCTALTTAPNLPATTLAKSCYSYMFRGCTALTTAPNLPATTLAEYCYSTMFDRCTSLTTVPNLPETALEIAGCYQYMFQRCSSLKVSERSDLGGKAWTCPSSTVDSALEGMFLATGGDFKGTPVSGTPYYIGEATKYGISVAGTQVTSANQADVLKDGTVSYEPTTSTLILDGANITSTANGIVFDNDKDNEVLVKGNCEISAVNTGIHTDCGSKFTVKGEDGASLKITCTALRGVSVYVGSQVSCAIENLDLTLSSNYICVYVNNNDLTVKNSEIDINITGDSGIYVNGDITFSGKDLIDVESSKQAIFAKDKITFDLDAGSKIAAKSGEIYKAISAGESIELNSATITNPVDGKVVTSSDGEYSYCGIGDGSKVTNTATVEVIVKDYEIAQTKAELVWEKGCCDILTVTSDADYDLFVKVLVDGVEVPKTNTAKDYDNYTVTKGSTKVSLTAGFLETLAAGDHTIEIVSSNGSAKGTFTIVEATKTEEKTEETIEEVAQTADNTAIGAFVALGMFAAAGVVTLKKKEN